MIMMMMRPLMLMVAATLGVVGAAAESSSNVAPLGVRHGSRNLEECGSLGFNYDYNIGNGHNLTSQKTDGNFNIMGSVRCDLMCDSGDAELYIRFGAEGGPADEDNHDAADTNAGCNKELMATNTEGIRPGFRYSVYATDYVNLRIECYCYTEEDPPTRMEMLEGNSGFGGGCFSESTIVMVKNKGPTLMKDLQVGDSVLVDARDNIYEPVYAFGHWDPNEEAEFIQIHRAEGEAPLEMTAEHLIYLQESDNEASSAVVRADEVSVGDSIVGGRGEVTKITMTTKKGLYMPLTASGKILVNDGLLVSSYVSFQEYAPAAMTDHAWLFSEREDRLMHAWLSPLRLLCRAKSCRTTSSGIHPWLLTGKELLEYVNDQPVILQVVIGFSILVMLVLFNGMEWSSYWSFLLSVGLFALLFWLIIMIVERRRSRASNKSDKQG